MPVATPPGAEPTRPWRRTLLLAVLFTAAAVVTSLVRFRTSPLYPPLNDINSDLFVYQLVGNSWTHGLLPYRDVYDVKGPFLYLLFGLFAHIQPWSMTPPWVALTLFAAASLVLCYTIARLYLRHRMPATVAAVAAGLTIYLTPAGVTTSFTCEELAIPGILLLLWLTIRWLRDHDQVRARWWTIDGIVVGALFWSKYLVIAPWLAMLLALTVVVVRGLLPGRDLLRVVGLHLVGVVLATLAILPFYAGGLPAMARAYFLAKRANIDPTLELAAEARFAGTVFTHNTAAAVVLVAILIILVARTVRAGSGENLALIISFAVSLWASVALVRHPNNLFIPLCFVAVTIPVVLAAGLARGRIVGAIGATGLLAATVAFCTATIAKSVDSYGLLQPPRSLTCYNLATSERSISRLTVSTVFADAAGHQQILSVGMLSSARSSYASQLPAERPFQFVDASWYRNIGADAAQARYLQDHTFNWVWVRIAGIDKFHNLPEQIRAATYTSGPNQRALAATLASNYTPVLGCNNDILLRAR